MFFNSLVNKTPQLAYKEKRSRHRLKCDTRALVQELTDSYIYRATIVNHNDKGLYLQTNVRLGLGKIILIGFDKSSSGSNPQTYQAEIKWEKRLTNLDYHYGYGAKYIHGPSNRKSEGPVKADLRKHAIRQFSIPTQHTISSKPFGC